MAKQTAEQIALALDRRYGSEPIGPELYQVLAEALKAGGYTDPKEIESVRKAIKQFLKEYREVRWGSL